MSADNGIYILETRGPEYRVAHLQAVENVDWDSSLGDYTDDSDIRINNAREMWKDCKVFTDKKEAQSYAFELYEKCGWTEYGVCSITINRKF